MALKLSHVSASLLAASTLLSASQAQAFQMFATDVVYYESKAFVDSPRNVEEKALGSNADDAAYIDFMSLGMGGRAVFSFGQAFSGDITVWEATWGNHTQASYDEGVDIYYGNFDVDTDWASVAKDTTLWQAAGDILNIADGAVSHEGATNAGEAVAGIFDYVMLVDKSTVQGDGFDVRAISATAASVPEPTSLLGLLILGSVGVKGLLKRKAGITG